MVATNPVLSLMEVSDQRALADATYFQAQVTEIEAGTGRVYILRMDDEDGLPDEEPYTRLAGFEPQVDDWVLMANWGRSAVCVGIMQRDAQPALLDLQSALVAILGNIQVGGNILVGGASGPGLYSGSGHPQGVVTAPIGSKYLRTDANSGIQEYVKVSGTGNTGWLSSYKAPRRRSIREIVCYEGASTSSSFVSKGFQNTPTIVANASANADDSAGWWLGHATTASTNNVASVVGGTNSNVQFRWIPDLSVAFKTGSSVTSVRYWIGLFASSPSGSDDPAIEGFGFRFSTNASDTEWQAWSNDGTSGGTITPTGIAIGGAGTSWELRCVVNEEATAIDFFMSGVWVARHTTNLPASSTNLNYGIYCTTLSGNVRQLRWGRITLESKP